MANQILPISKAQAIKVITWLKKNYGNDMAAEVKNTLFTVDTLCAIVCQETGYVLANWIDKKTPSEILKLCVFDASGDFPGTSRSAFPKNRAAFERKYSKELTEMLVEEANKSRAERKYSPAKYLYKGYGIFQYDLQYILSDKTFFEWKLWYRMDECLKRVMKELNSKWAIHKDMWKTLKGYNGAGQAATNYANNVTIYISYSREVKI